MLPCPANLQDPHAPSHMQSAADKATAVKKTQETKKKAAPKRKSAAGKDEGEEKPKKATPKKKQGGKKGGDKNGEVLKQFQLHVNMDQDELKVSHCGGVAGLTMCTPFEPGGSLLTCFGSQKPRQILLQQSAACQKGGGRVSGERVQLPGFSCASHCDTCTLAVRQACTLGVACICQQRLEAAAGVAHSLTSCEPACCQPFVDWPCCIA